MEHMWHDQQGNDIEELKRSNIKELQKNYIEELQGSDKQN